MAACVSALHPHARRWRLTPPSSGRPKGRFAPFGPPLMSNVRHRVDEPFHPPIQVLGNPLQWARAHPSYFFAGGIASAESLAEQLVAGARALGATEVEAHVVGDWSVVASRTDWYAGARFTIPEDFNFHELTPFPELGQNCVRPECVVAAFAKYVVVRNPSGIRIVKGALVSNDPILAHIAEVGDWQRAIAFRGFGDA